MWCFYMKYTLDLGVISPGLHQTEGKVFRWRQTAHQTLVEWNTELFSWARSTLIRFKIILPSPQQQKNFPCPFVRLFQFTREKVNDLDGNKKTGQNFWRFLFQKCSVCRRSAGPYTARIQQRNYRVARWKHFLPQPFIVRLTYIPYPVIFGAFKYCSTLSGQWCLKYRS